MECYLAFKNRLYGHKKTWVNLIAYWSVKEAPLKGCILSSKYMILWKGKSVEKKNISDCQGFRERKGCISGAQRNFREV